MGGIGTRAGFVDQAAHVECRSCGIGQRQIDRRAGAVRRWLLWIVIGRAPEFKNVRGQPFVEPRCVCAQMRQVRVARQFNGIARRLRLRLNKELYA